MPLSRAGSNVASSNFLVYLQDVSCQSCSNSGDDLLLKPDNLLIRSPELEQKRCVAFGLAIRSFRESGCNDEGLIRRIRPDFMALPQDARDVLCLVIVFL